MLSPAERDLAARDPALPGLTLLLNTDALAARLGLGRLHDLYLRYKPGTSCTLAFRPDRGGDLSAFVALAYPPDRYAALRARPKLQGRSDIVFFDAQCLTVLPMAMDRDLPVLARLADRGKRGKTLEHAFGKHWAQGQLTLLRYNPRRRAVLRLQTSEGRAALVKAYASEDWARVLQGARLAEAYGGTRVIGAAEAEGLLGFEWVEGQPLWSDRDGLVGEGEVSATGTALARLHKEAGPPGCPKGYEEELDGLAAATSAVGALLPSLAPRAEALAQATGRELEKHDRAPSLIHGDFSADQVILSSSGPVLIDWDRAGFGDPARDLGSFLARLDVQVMDGLLSRDEAARARNALLTGYERVSSIPAGLDALHARALLALMPEGFRQRRADWPERIAAILDSVEALLPIADAASDSLRPLLDRARNPDAAGPIVVQAAGLTADAGVDVMLIRQKPARRALIRYTLRGGTRPISILGKLRAKGPDRRTPRVHEALRTAGLDGGSSSHRVGVPRALGAADDLHLWLQEEVPGHRITEHLIPSGPTRAAARAGEALAKLHGCAVDAPRRWSPADELEVLRKSLEGAAAAMPSEAPRLADLLTASTAFASQLGPGPETGIHRDWHPDQALLDGDILWILDLDLYAQGDPAIDLGNFAAHITELSIRRHGDSAALANHETSFLHGYAAAGGCLRLNRVLAWKAVSLARLVGISQRIPDRHPATVAILEAAEQLLSNCLAHDPTYGSQKHLVRGWNASSRLPYYSLSGAAGTNDRGVDSV